MFVTDGDPNIIKVGKKLTEYFQNPLHNLHCILSGSTKNSQPKVDNLIVHTTYCEIYQIQPQIKKSCAPQPILTKFRTSFKAILYYIYFTIISRKYFPKLKRNRAHF